MLIIKSTLDFGIELIIRENLFRKLLTIIQAMIILFQMFWL